MVSWVVIGATPPPYAIESGWRRSLVWPPWNVLLLAVFLDKAVWFAGTSGLVSKNNGRLLRAPELNEDLCAPECDDSH